MKLLFRYISFFAALFYLISCSNNEYSASRSKRDRKVNITKETQSDSLGNPEYFHSLPQNFGLAGDFYTFDSSKLSENRYIFLSNLADSAAIKMNGEIVYLHIDTLGSNKLSDDLEQNVWKGNGYIVVVTLKVLREEKDEEVYCVGTLEIIRGNKMKKFKIHGVTIA